MKYARSNTSHLFSATLLATVSAPALWAAEVDLNTEISDVKLYRNGGAVITRLGELTVAQGSHTVTIKDLPSDINKEYGVRAQLISAEGTITQVKLDEQFTDRVTSDAQKTLSRQIDELEEKVTQDQAKIESLNIQLRFIESMGNRASDNAFANGNADTAFATLEKTLGFVTEKSGKIITERSRLTKTISETTAHIRALRQELQQTGNERESYTEATITLSKAASSPALLEVSYMVKGGGWSVTTEANLNTVSNSTNINLYALVSQQSGEDWTNIPLTLSTTMPSMGIHHTNPEPTYFNLVDAPQASDMSMIRLKSSIQQDQYRLESFAVIGPGQTEYSENNFDGEFIIGTPATVEADGSQQRFLISSANSDAEVILRTTPSQDLSAYVYADTTLEEFPTIINPSVSVTRDGTYVGRGQWPTLRDGETLELPFGASDRIDVNMVTLPSNDGDSGIFNKKVREEEKKQFKITNNNSVPVTLEVFDRLPNSMNEDLEIEAIRGTTTPTETNIDDQPGVIMWRKTVAPGETWVINHWYRITYPEGQRLINR
jgi:uncharacterized protein (TIGR02231 family)